MGSYDRGFQGWVGRVLDQKAFAYSEGEALEYLRRYGMESGFCVQYWVDGRMRFEELEIGGTGSVRVAVPHGGDRLLHVHYHPSGSLGPSRNDVYAADADAAILRKELGAPPVHMIGALVDGSPFYLARQRPKFPGYLERFCVARIPKERWRPLARRVYEMETNRQLADAVRSRIGEAREQELRSAPVDDVLRESGINQTEIELMAARAVERAYGLRVGVYGPNPAAFEPEVGSCVVLDLDADGAQTGQRSWLYGSAEQFV